MNWFIIGIVIAVIVLLGICLWIGRKPKSLARPVDKVLARKPAPYDDGNDWPERRYNRSPYAGTTQRRQDDDSGFLTGVAIGTVLGASDARPAEASDHSPSSHDHSPSDGGGGFSTGEGFGGGGFETGGGFGGDSGGGSIGGGSD